MEVPGAEHVRERQRSWKSASISTVNLGNRTRKASVTNIKHPETINNSNPRAKPTYNP